MLDPEIYDRITDDRCPQLEELWDDDYIGGFVDGEIASIATFEPFRDSFQLHFQVLKEYRPYARDLLEKSLSGLISPLYAQIPACFMTTLNFAKHQGFKTVEIEEKSYLKYGDYHDRHLLKRDICPA